MKLGNKRMNQAILQEGYEKSEAKSYSRTEFNHWCESWPRPFPWFWDCSWSKSGSEAKTGSRSTK